MLCPSCGTDIPDDLPECVNCGLILIKHAAPRSSDALSGVERTRFDPAPDAPVERLPGLESTSVVEEGFPPPDDAPIDIEPTQVRSPEGAAPAWEGTVIGFDRGRETDAGEPTPPPGDESVCVWCGAPATGVFCEACGHRRAASERPGPQEAKRPADVESVFCPACFARRPPYHDEVSGIDRCGECGVPLPDREG
jgi:hypothetical protein